MSVKARAASHHQWLEDLAALKRNAKARFADVSWDDGAGNFIHAHKVIVYSRAAGSFQQRYLAAPTSTMHESTLSLPNQRSLSRRSSVTPAASATSHVYSGPSSSGHSQERCSSPTSMISTISAAAIPLSLSGTDPALFEACLDYLYTGEKGAEGVAVLFDGFGDGVRENESEVDGAVKLREDLMYSWRSKLFADVTIALDDTAETTFTAHRAILCSRSPYFQSLLLGSYGDSRLNHFTLPSPPFTSASTTFILGYIYTGTLQFSSRKFDLTTAFEIWRGAAFLSLSLLQEEVELKIEEMANLQRAARIFSFAHAPDVNCPRLARVVEPWVVDKFGDVWAGAHIGNLDYDVQKKLVRDVCSKIKPDSITSIAKMTLSLRKRLELEKAMWAEHVVAMLGAIEDELVSVLSRHLSAVVHSPGFVDLVDGVGFSTDVLEWMLELIVRGLREAKAPEAYQALVGSVLLREAGILIDAKVLVEDARNGILKYVQRKWIGIRAARGFDDLEPWCLKELSDEIEVSVEDLLADAPKLGNIAARSTLRPSMGANGTIKATPSEKRRPALPAHPTPPATAVSSSPATTTRTPRLSTTSTASRMTTATTASRASSVASTSRTPTATAAAAPRTNGASTTAARGASVNAGGARGGASTGTSSRPGRPSTSSTAAPPLPTASSSTSSPSTTTSAAPRAAPRTSSSSSRPPTTAPRPRTLSARSSSTSLRSTAPPVRPTRTAAASTLNGAAPSPSLSSRLSTAASRSTSATIASSRGTATSTTRRPPSLAPTLASRPSTTSLASTSSTPRPPVPRATATKPLTPASARPRTTSTPSTATKAVPASAKGKEKAVPAAVTSPATRRPPSVTSTKSTATLRRPASTTSITSVRAPATTTRPSSAASVKSISRKPTTSAAPLKSPTKPLKTNGTPTRSTNATPNRPGARGAAAAQGKGPSADEATTVAEPKQQLPGTMLLSGIPCIVTVRSDRPTRFRAVVRYIGEVLWGEGQWVGVEAAESAIPPEARELAWNDGEVAGVTYFKIAPGSGRSSGRTTPSPSEGHDLRPSAASSSNGGSIGGSGASSLRPPSRRQRRSSSSEPDRDGGPRKGLFVRPNQIVYVL